MNDTTQAFVFKNRGALLAIPAVVLVVFGKPAGVAIAVGLILAVLGELIRVWAVGFSGMTTRGDHVEAPELVSAGPYAYVRNPLYVGNFVTALGFAIAFTGGNEPVIKCVLILASLAVMIAVYAIIVPHEEQFLAGEFGDAFTKYRAEVPPLFPRLTAAAGGNGVWKPEVILNAETRTWFFFAIVVVILVIKAVYFH